MGTIVAIGGGDLRLEETMTIDKYIVELSGTPNPKLLFIPTASGDSQGYIDVIKKIYGEQLGCDIDTLLLIDNDINEYEIQEKFLWSNIIYVGGGDTVKMMDIWRDKQIDKYLKKAYENNIILSGVSAGSICWFTKGHSDNNLRTNPEGWWDYTQAVGIDLIPAIHCPHYNEKGHQIFDEIMKTEELPGIAIENNCAIVIKDDMYRIIKSDNIRKAYLLKSYNGVIDKYELNNFSFSPISEIL
ncbi:Type 1 glutamine amidotransferase-like domain-containing protein [Clostridium sp.]|uniref:Type 1 glutamine amidotransferase-like domain-containing protein n=1 Tax=Clostridium sp. TaxID=1506 RepID=UPI0034645FA2